MTIPTAAPLAVVGVMDSSGLFEVQTSPAHGLATNANVVIGGCRTAAGALVAGLNLTEFAVTVVDPTHFTLQGSTYASGYSYGGGVWVVGGEISHAPLTTLDAQLALRVAAKNGDKVSGAYSLRGSPGMALSSPGTSILTNSPGSSIATPDTTVQFVLGDGDNWQLLPARKRSIMVSCLEAFQEYLVDAMGNFQFQTGQLLPGAPTFAGRDMTSAVVPAVRDYWIPLSRLHDKSTLVAATLLFFPNQLAAAQLSFSLPTVMPTLQVFRYNPSTDVTLTSLAANGAAVFPSPASVASYASTPAVGSTGLVMPGFLLLEGTVSVPSGAVLIDSTGNTFRVAQGTNTNQNTPISIVAVAPVAPAPFMGTNTNHGPGDTLAWQGTPPAGLGPTVTVSSAGLTGGLNAGYAQQLVFTPDAALAEVDQGTYVYVLRITDDNISYANGQEPTFYSTAYAGVRLDFSGITSLAPQ